MMEHRLAYLKELQTHNLADLLVAHDVGLVYYWQAKRCGLPEAAAHWRGVISHWALIWEDDAYWQQWSQQRSRVYGKLITADHLGKVRQKLTEQLVQELTDIAHEEACQHLEAMFNLEMKAIRLLKQASALSLLPAPQCGPLLARQLGLESQVNQFFERWPGMRPRSTESLQAILQPLQKDKRDTNLKRDLRMSFSQLGLASIYLEQNKPKAALDVLTTQVCPTCAPAAGTTGSAGAQAMPFLAPCQPGCAYFARHNPAYAALVKPVELYTHHLTELLAAVHLSLAHRALLVEPANISDLYIHLSQVLAFGERLGLHNQLKTELGETLLGWAEGLQQNERWDDAIALLERAVNFDETERWQGRLAGLLNMRGVQAGNEQSWETAVIALRRAYALNPHNTQIGENLQNVLRAYADAMFAAGDSEKGRCLLDEAVNLSRIPPATTEILKRRPLRDDERVHPVLFDEWGLLRMALFNASGQAVLTQAREMAIDRGEALLEPPAIVGALLQTRNGELTRLLRLQSIEPGQVALWLEMTKPGEAMPSRLHDVTVLSQFDLWFSVLKVFELAWEVAQYDQGQIGAEHLLYGLLISHCATPLFEGVGIDANQLLKQAAWHE